MSDRRQSELRGSKSRSRTIDFLFAQPNVFFSSKLTGTLRNDQNLRRSHFVARVNEMIDQYDLLNFLNFCRILSSIASGLLMRYF